MFSKEKFELHHVTKTPTENSISKQRGTVRAKLVIVWVCLFNFGVYRSTFQNTDFKVRCPVSLVPTAVAEERQNARKSLKIHPEPP